MLLQLDVFSVGQRVIIHIYDNVRYGEICNIIKYPTDVLVDVAFDGQLAQYRIYFVYKWNNNEWILPY